KNASGAVTWEGNANRTFTTPVNASVILNNTWGTLTSPPPTIIPATAVPTTPPTTAPTGTATTAPTSTAGATATATTPPTATATPGGQGVKRVKYQAGTAYVVVEILDDDLVHFEASALTAAPSTDAPLFTTPLVAKTNYPGPASFSQAGNTLETADLRLTVNPTSLCVTVHDKLKAITLTTTCPADLTSAMKKMTMTPESMQNVYGLGQQFFREGANGDWTGRVRSPGSFGNVMSGDGANGGAVGNTQIPVMYALGANNANYALYADQVYKQRWDFVASPWTFETEGEQVRWYVLSGPSLADLRQDYLELTGKPPVPPKKAFGLWVSEYGYDNWAELEGKLATLRTNAFPVDGFVLDLQWFGGITGSDATRMGSLTWDQTRFPNPAAKIASYKTTEGLGIIPIEESYIGKALPEHTDLENRGYLVRAGCATCAPVYLTSNPWWGKGGMIDWTSDAAGDYWHDSKRKALIDAGVTGHWIDLGEPEMFAANDWTQGVIPGKHDHASYHNVYNFKWAESIFRGYGRTDAARRPFMLSRSGAAGIQRLGVAMWSGDIGSDLQNLASQQNAQMHMSLSGIDYYGSDIGGFHRGGDVNTSYTQWFANSVWTDVPIRPHTENLCNCKETAPDRIGDKASNLANLRMRYELTPYYYSLAHRAALTGEPIVPPLVYHYQNDANVRELGSQKLIGRDILVATTVGADTTQRDVYLPAGDWVDYYTNQWLHSAGQSFAGQPAIRGGKFQVPAYARAGAILPKMHIDAQSMNLAGLRSDGTTRNELIVRVYGAPAATSFTLYEDDGETTAYQTGAVRTTLLSQQQSGSTSTVTIGAASGTYAGAPAARGAVVELVADGRAASAVTLNGTPLTRHATKAAFDAAGSGWYNAGSNLIVAKSAPASVATAQTFAFTLDGSVPTPTPMSATATPTVTGGGIATTFNVYAQTVFGENIFVVGNLPALGAWNTAQAVALSSAAYPTWSGTVQLPPATAIEYKYIKKNASGAVIWESGSNRLLTTPGSGTATQNDTWR
ncbi:MAG TPA: TIM-barrel domain-containing protein, partial [Herpetosiphonaceae bacterium]|nr:TIM-barrel domain-containing protein [Herpetosiphonaceae bacterium]